MEFTPKTCKKKGRKHVTFFDDLLHVCHGSSDSSDSESDLHLAGLLTKYGQGESSHGQQKRDYLTRLFEKKKLKEKSLSKKMRTPLDRKLYRTCWPIELGKISRIKKKPEEKTKRKPTHKSLRRKKFSNPTFVTRARGVRHKHLPIIRSLACRGKHKTERYRHYKCKPHFYAKVTPQMLIQVLKDPEHFDTGATIDVIMTKLRTMRLSLHPSDELLKQEVTKKLNCAVAVRLLVESNGYYRLPFTMRIKKIQKKKLTAFWKLWRKKLHSE